MLMWGPLPIGIMTPLALRGMPSRSDKFTSKVVPPTAGELPTFAHKSIVKFTSLAQQCFTAPKMRFCSDLFSQNWRSFDKQQYFCKSRRHHSVPLPHHQSLLRDPNNSQRKFRGRNFRVTDF